MKKILNKIISFFTLKRIIKIFICLFACTFILCVAIHYSLTYLIQSQGVKNKIVTFADEKMNLELDFNKLSANIFYFSLDDVKIKIKGDTKDFFYVKEITLYFAPIRLLFGKIHIFRIGILNPNIVISKNSD